MSERPRVLEADGDQIAKYCSSSFYDPLTDPWERIEHTILGIEQNAFKDQADSVDQLSENFKNPDSTIGVIKDQRTDTIVGFSVMMSARIGYPLTDYAFRLKRTLIDLKTTAYVIGTALEKPYQHHGLAVPLLKLVENQLWDRGFRFLERDAADDGYADTLRKNNHDRILIDHPHPSRFGPQVFFRMNLRNPNI